MASSFANRWLRVSIPIQGLVLLSQLITGLNANHIPWSVYRFVHMGGGSTLALLVAIHVIINRDWLWKTYFTRPCVPSPTGSLSREEGGGT